MDIASQLARDVAELARRLRAFHDFYYALIEAKQISLNLNPKLSSVDTIEVMSVDKAEWDRWQKIKSIINAFEVPN